MGRCYQVPLRLKIVVSQICQELLYEVAEILPEMQKILKGVGHYKFLNP